MSMEKMRPAERSSIVRSHGFTLPEVLMATFVSVLLITGLLATVVQMRSAMRAQQLLGEMHQNTRFAMDTLSRDIRMAGYGLDVPPSLVSDWVVWLPGIGKNPEIEEGASGAPDALNIVAAFDGPVAILSTSASIGDTNLNLTAVGDFSLKDGLDTYDHGLIFIGKSTTARITSKSPNGDSCGISIHPDRAMGLKYDYPAGTAVELVKTIRYEWKPGEQFVDFPYIRRDDSSEVYDQFEIPVVAAYIEDFQITELADGWEVSLTGIVSQPDRFYTHPIEGDNFRRETLVSMISKRN